MQKIIIIANWKMNPKTVAEAQQLFEAVGKGIREIDGAAVVICPPFVYISELFGAASSFARPKTSYGGSSVAFGSQDCFWEDSGAFTGEISPSMLKNLGCSYVILGHSERRNYLGETFEMTNKKVRAVLAVGLTPVVCIGEEIEKEMGVIFHDIKNWKLKIENLVLVYEPEWAISTNKGAVAATPEDCRLAIELMRKVAKKMFGDIQIPILYGGSTNSKNIKGIIESGAQGALVGSASLNAQEFIELVRNAAIK